MSLKRIETGPQWCGEDKFNDDLNSAPNFSVMWTDAARKPYQWVGDDMVPCGPVLS